MCWSLILLTLIIMTKNRLSPSLCVWCNLRKLATSYEQTGYLLKHFGLNMLLFPHDIRTSLHIFYIYYVYVLFTNRLLLLCKPFIQQKFFTLFFNSFALFWSQAEPKIPRMRYEQYPPSSFSPNIFINTPYLFACLACFVYVHSAALL